MKSGKNIDEIFQKVFEAETFSYKDEYWKGAQEALAGQNGKRLGLRGLINGSKILGISLAASVVFAAMLPFAMTSSKDEKAIAMTQVGQQLGDEQGATSKKTDVSSFSESNANENFKGRSQKSGNTESYIDNSGESGNSSSETLNTVNNDGSNMASTKSSDREERNLAGSGPLTRTNTISTELPNGLDKSADKNGSSLLAQIEPNGKKSNPNSIEHGADSDNGDSSPKETIENNLGETSGGHGLALGKTGEMQTPHGGNNPNSDDLNKRGEASTSTETLANSPLETSIEESDTSEEDENNTSMATSDESGRSKSQLSVNLETAVPLDDDVMKQGSSRPANRLVTPWSVHYWENGLLLESGLTLSQMPLLDLPGNNKFPTPITHKPVWTLGLETNYNVFAKNLAQSNLNPYLTERANGETLENTFGYGLRLARTTRTFTTQIGLQYGSLNENISYTSTDTIVKREFVGVKYVSRMAVDGGTVSRGETVYDTIILDTTYAEIENHTQNSVRFLEVPVYVGKRFNYKKFGFDIGLGASWQRVINQSGYVINAELDGLNSLDGFLSKNAFNGMAGLNADYQFAEGWRVGVSARYKVPIGALRFDSDFRLQQYNYGFSISREIF